MRPIQKARPIQQHSFNSDFRVDIVLPFHGQYRLVLEACKSIWKNTRNMNYQIYLVDDASPNSTYLGAFKDSPNVTTLQHEKQTIGDDGKEITLHPRGFASSLKTGFDAGRNPWVVFMHSDVRIDSPGWLEELYESYIRYPRCVMVSPRTNESGDCHPALQADSKLPSGVDTIVEKGFLPLHCALFRRDLFSKIGFLKLYPFRYYEDEELAHRIRKSGACQVISGKAWIFHHGAATVGEMVDRQEQVGYNGPDWKKVIEYNQSLYEKDTHETS
jgi:GT2 family glycosyltransferase